MQQVLRPQSANLPICLYWGMLATHLNTSVVDLAEIIHRVVRLVWCWVYWVCVGVFAGGWRDGPLFWTAFELPLPQNLVRRSR